MLIVFHGIRKNSWQGITHLCESLHILEGIIVHMPRNAFSHLINCVIERTILMFGRRNITITEECAFLKNK